MLLDIILFLVGIALLYWGAETMVKNSSWLAKNAGISPLIIGMTVVAFGTSAPELLVSTVASTQGNSDIAIGNVIGSNIANIGLILGLVVLIWPPKSEEKAVRREFPFLIVVTGLLFALSLDGTIGRIDGIVLLLLFTVFIYYNIATVRRKMMGKLKHELEEIEEKIEDMIEHKRTRRREMFRNIAMAVFGLAILLAGSKLLVDSAVSVAESVGVSQMVIGLSMVALGTSLPELITSVVAALKKEDQINVGMILGSNIFNTLLILGVAAVILPISVSARDIYVSLPIVFLFTVSVFPVLKENVKTYRLIGLFMLLGYFAFIMYSFLQ